MAFAKFQENRFRLIIDGEINEKHAYSIIWKELLLYPLAWVIRKVSVIQYGRIKCDN